MAIKNKEVRKRKEKISARADISERGCEMKQAQVTLRVHREYRTPPRQNISYFSNVFPNIEKS